MKQRHALSLVLLTGISQIASASPAINNIISNPQNLTLNSNDVLPTHRFFSKEIFTFGNLIDQHIAITFYEGLFRDSNFNNRITFELAGNLSFSDKKGIRTDLKNDGSDGNIMFELTHEDLRFKRYSGFSCSSSATDCSAHPDFFEFTYNKGSKIWTLDFSFTRYETSETGETKSSIIKGQATFE